MDNRAAGAAFGDEEVRKVVGMAGVQQRRVVADGQCASDLCTEAAHALLAALGWAPESIDALIMVTQSPDYFLPSTGCLVHRDLGLADDCAAFDVGLGCSGYPYGLFLASAMIRSGHRRVILLHGETPSLFPSQEDRATSLLFGDAGSATALSANPGAPASHFQMCTDGSGYDALIIRGGGFRDRQPAIERNRYLFMDGAAIFNFTIQRVPPLIREILDFAQTTPTEVDGFLFHQSNQFIMRHLVKKCGLPPERVPIILAQFGNTGGASVPLAATVSYGQLGERHGMQLLMLGYGVGLSWAGALMHLPADAVLLHRDHPDRQTA